MYLKFIPYPGNCRRHREDRGPAAELLDDFVLPGCGKQQARLEGGRQTFAQIDDGLVDQQHVIVHIAKIRSYCRTSARKVVTPQLVANLDHWPDSMAHVEKAGTQAVDPLDLFRGWHRRKDIILEDLKLFA